MSLDLFSFCLLLLLLLAVVSTLGLRLVLGLWLVCWILCLVLPGEVLLASLQKQHLVALFEQRQRDAFVAYSGGEYTIIVAMLTGDDSLVPLVCPVEPDHRIKVRVIQSSSGSSSDCHCPYCGHTAPTWDFLPAQMARVQAAAAGVGQQYLQQLFSDIFGDLDRRHSGSSGAGISLSYRPGTPPPSRPLPAYEIEPTQRSMTCLHCGETFAVYGLVIYCPECGQLAPQQQLAELVRVQRDRLAALERLDDDIRRELKKAGVFTATYESTFKDGFTALETYLKNRFHREATNVAKQPLSTTFQRLDDTNALYVAYVGVDLRQRAGQPLWDELQQAAAIRHVLGHNNGVIDDKFLTRQPRWPQRLGERIQVRRADVDSFVDALERITAAVL
jgi:hypothetical protein